MKYKHLFIIPFILLIILLLTGCSTSTNSNELKYKVVKEIDYLDNKIFTIANSLNGIYLENHKIETKEINDSKTQPKQEEGDNQSSSEDNLSNNQKQKIDITEMKTTSILSRLTSSIDWNYIKSEIELLDNTWATIVLDLYKLDVPGDIINNFSSNLNTAILKIKNEDVNSSLETLTNLYSNLPQYLEYAMNNKEEINLKNTKYYILKTYYQVSIDNWNDIDNEINKAIQYYSPVINNLEFSRYKEHSVNRVYILLNELKNSLKTYDKDVFYINYKNLINEINVI